MVLHGQAFTVTRDGHRIGEVVPPKIRGALVSFNQLAITAGILVSYLVDYGLASSQNWRLMFGLAAIPAALMFTGMLFQHQSPHWLAAHGQEDKAREVLRRVRNESDIDAEIAEVQELSGRQSSFREVLNPAVRHVMIIGVALAVFQQITGINTIIYYAPTLLAQAGLGNSAALLANVVNGAVNVLMTIVAIRLLDRTGRRPLLIGGTTGMAVGMLVVGFTFLIGGSQLHGGGAYIAIAGLLIYTGSFAIGLGPVFWLLISEIYPVKIRGQAMSVATNNLGWSGGISGAKKCRISRGRVLSSPYPGEPVHRTASARRGSNPAVRSVPAPARPEQPWPELHRQER